MRLLLDFDGTHHEIEVDRALEETTLAALVVAAGGPQLEPGDIVAVDARTFPADTELKDVTLLEGTRIARDPEVRPHRFRSWNVTLVGGTEAGAVVQVPESRPLVAGRSPHADLVLPTASASWEHCTIAYYDPAEDRDEDEEDEAGKRRLRLPAVSLPRRKRADQDGEGNDAAEDDAAGDGAERDKTGQAKTGREASASQPDAEPEDEETEGLRILDSGSTNGTYVNGQQVPEEGTVVHGPATVTVGGAVLLIRPELDEALAPAPGSLHNLTPAATAPFNRPPRPGEPPAPDAIEPPAHKEVAPASKFNLIMVIAPLIMAVVMVMVLRNMTFALFALLSPVMAVGTWWEGKRRRKIGLKEEDERFEKAMKEFQEQTLEAGQEEIGRRRDLIPDPATTMRRALLPATTLWQRRYDSDDFLYLHAGTGDVPWKPALDNRGTPKPVKEVRKVMEDYRLTAAPVLVDLTDAGVVGIVGEREGALALARSLALQAAIHCGPADLTVGVFCAEGREDEWEWASWLPHTRMPGSSTGERWIASGRENNNALLRGLRDRIDEFLTPGVLMVLDSETLTEGRDAPARDLLGYGRTPRDRRTSLNERARHRVSGIVIAASEEQLPAACTAVIRVGADAAASVTQPQDLTQVDDAVLAGLTREEVASAARNLAHFEDPELVVPGASLPGLVRLPELLGYSRPDGDAILQMWNERTGVSSPIGVGESGPLVLDLVKDGPHGLVGGTTGSGKSEFLRSFIAGLAARNDPTTLNFILVDFKGGAAFKAAERFPHTIGTISNLDEQLADRAIRALEAEMERRQRIFAAAGEGIDNLPAYLATNPEEPMPRILLVIDEFAMLAKDFPDVLEALVSVAAVGRTLGVHMILATQRPAGVVNDDILANTNLRVALRVQSREDSSNVIDVPDAASISRAQMGRAFVKLGQDDINPVQTALSTGQAQDGPVSALELRAVGRFGRPAPRKAPPRSAASDENDLDLLIEAVLAANETAGFAAPRQVWPQALGERVDLAGFSQEGVEPERDEVGRRLIAEVGGLQGPRLDIALVDQPDQQRQVPGGWDLSDGNLLLMGIPGSGTTTTLATIALNAAREWSPEELDILVLDMGSRELEVLKDLPHTTAYVGTGPGAREQQTRFLRHLRKDLEARRAAPAQARRTLVLVDGMAALRDEFNDFVGMELMENLYRAYADGPALGLSFAVSTTRAKSVPGAMDDVTSQRWLFRLADPYDYSSLGVKGKDLPASVPGRAVNPRTLQQMHVATPAIGIADAVQRIKQQWAGSGPKHQVIQLLPEEISVSQIAQMGGMSRLDQEPWLLPIGLAEATFTPANLEVYEGEHVMIVGPARSGKSTLLLAMMQSLREARTEEGAAPKIWVACDRRSPLASCDADRIAVGQEDLPALIASARIEPGPVFLFMDDVERIDDSDQSISGLINANIPGLCVVAAGRAADLRTMYGHWSKLVRKSRLGVALQPDVDYDGDLIGGQLPRRSPVALTTGRGFIGVGGQIALVQTMSPDDRVGE